MKLILKNHTEEYAAREIITAYLPKIKIELCDDIPPEEDYVLSAVSAGGSVCEYSSTLRLNGEVYKERSFESTLNKTYVKKSIGSLLKKATGISLPWGLITGIRPSKLARELSEGGMERAEIEKIFSDFYLCEPSKTKLALDVAHREAELIGTMPENSVSLYIGIPFCPTRCLYCSFTTQSVRFSSKLTEPYLEALSKELRATAEIIEHNSLKADTVYIGGGTPTSLNEEQLNRLLDDIQACFDLSAVREFTLEAGRPDTITEEKLRIAAGHGISRISINPQSMNQKTLDIIGRKHTPYDIIRTYEMAVKHGFKHINTDIIAGLPGEDEHDFEHTMDEIEKLNPQSVTVHTMSIKRGSYLDRDYSMYTPSAAECVNAMLSAAAERMNSLGKKPYYMYRQKNMLGNLENVGYSCEGDECLYNIYIMEEVQSIYAMGAGASTKITNKDKIERIFNVKEVSEYINRIDEMIMRKDILKGD